MPTLNATVYPDEAYVLVEADWTSHPTVTHARVVRRNTVTGEEVTLRPYTSYDGDGNLLLNCGMGVWWDTEPPLDVPLEYCTYAADPPTALTTNCCFETNTAGWVGGNALIAQNSSYFKEGAFSARMTVFAGNPYNITMRQVPNTAFVAGVPIKASAWIRAEKTIITSYSPTVYMQMEFTLDNGLTETHRSALTILDYAEWRYIEMAATPSRAGTLARVEITAINTPPPAGVDFFIDIIQATQAQPLSASACETVTVAGDDRVFLKSPMHPCLDVVAGLCDPMMGDDCDEDTRVSYLGTDDQSRAANTVLLAPVNRKRPIPVSRQRRDVISALRLLAHDCDARDALVAINDTGDPLLFQAPARYCIEDRYISVGDFTETHISVDQGQEPRILTMSYAVVDRPQGPSTGVCGARIRDLCDVYASWAAFTVAGLDWRDLLLGNASGEGPGGTPAARTWDEVEAEFTDWTAVSDGGTRTWDELRDGA